jgi:hypothetical protein
MKTLVVTPTEETLQRLRNVMLSAPFELDWKSMLVEVASAPDAPTWETSDTAVYPDVKVYQVHPKLVIHPVTQQPLRTLVALCTSPTLVYRAGQLGNNVDHFEWVLSTSLQESRSVRSFVASMATTLVVHEGPFSFTNEMTIDH